MQKPIWGFCLLKGPMLSQNTAHTDTDVFLDITPDVCPLTFVKTKIAIEKMAVGETVEVRLNDGEPLKNVPRSVEEHGHQILSLEQEEEGSQVWRLVVRKA
jgi:TusA-related sulfurtransferase